MKKAKGGRKPASPEAEPRPELKPGFGVRAAASKILSAVVDRKVPLDGMLDVDHGNAAYLALTGPDRALARMIITTVLRHKPQIDAAIDGLLERPLPSGARALSHVLSVAAAQILYLDVPDHAAVDIAVEQAGADPRNRRFAGLVNAVLRRLSRQKDRILTRIADVPAMPQWFYDRLVAVYGENDAAIIADAQLTPPTIDLSVKSDAEGWAEKLGGTVLPGGTVRLATISAPVPQLPGYEEGEWWVQDAAAAIPARLFGDLSGKRVIDLCAAPGGKTAQLIQQGGEVTALERSKNRLKRLNENLDRLKLSAITEAADMLDYKPDALFDCALLDAPCSSTGTTRRHPDVLWTKDDADIEKLAEVQFTMVMAALKLIRPGGMLIFSNCSLDPREGENVTARAIAEGAVQIAFPEDGRAGLETLLNETGAIRTTPASRLGNAAEAALDGFYAVALTRN
ncbi:RsmB/NOP family class I SAM-dependent RNA methyltransferase [Martelella alba]|uniref:RsmB/NOP family class I SAM-dependent RNA methyltransferase n=1 Tax=Martelella alba TaxID=2590451 RepID=A0A506UEJ4_9HYPH|nr:RsmB/NOP family class I SAM-dependent RNA methyltransferase [Martelella alba]TPW31169.1 RsmB/NOP family class I SAM-dependent RNA methyltransferase [Martelella alba]